MREFYTEFSHLHFTKIPQEAKVKKNLSGLHALLSKDNTIRFSVVVSGNSPLSLKSAQNQTAQNFEVIREGQEPKGTHVFFLKEGEFMRMDLLYRYEQVLRVQKEDNVVLHTTAAVLDHNHRLVPGTLFEEPRKMVFPYEFKRMTLNGLLIPKAFYKPKLTPWDLDLQGAKFLGIPLPLLGRQLDHKYEVSLSDYFVKKGLDWQVENGRILPKIDHIPHIQVVVPFKDNKNLTLAAIDSILKSVGVKVFVTAIDNGSEDLTIGEKLKCLGCEVMRIEEPFNYSRLNNLAVNHTLHPQELVFFMNNDAEMDRGALLEMSRWIAQPKIGLVGCRLHFPTGLPHGFPPGPLQHGGVVLDQSSALPGALNWIHDESPAADQVHISDAVTAAAALIKRENFLSVGGFDEVLYPVAYSDTNLAHKLAKKGLLSLYTPYATGIHHESVSRQPGILEDFDRSLFLHNLTI